MKDQKAVMADERVVGTFLKLPSTSVIDIAAEAFDFVVVDREHSQLSSSDALAMIGHGHAIGLPVILRLPMLDPGEVNRALEGGAAGIQLSQVGTAADIRSLREACEYAPLGKRSVSLGHPLAGYGKTDMKQYIEGSLGRPLVVAQIESSRTPDSYEEILEARPDVAFVGMADLTVDTGFDQAELGKKIEEVRAAARANEVILGGIQMDDDPQVRFSMVSSDLMMLRQAMIEARVSAGNESNENRRSER